MFNSQRFDSNDDAFIGDGGDDWSWAKSKQSNQIVDSSWHTCDGVLAVLRSDDDGLIALALMERNLVSDVQNRDSN